MTALPERPALEARPVQAACKDLGGEARKAAAARGAQQETQNTNHETRRWKRSKGGPRNDKLC